jgi:hypothetical protein
MGSGATAELARDTGQLTVRIRVVDHARSKRNTRSFDYKHNWGFIPAPLEYEFRQLNGAGHSAQSEVQGDDRALEMPAPRGRHISCVPWADAVREQLNG